MDIKGSYYLSNLDNEIHNSKDVSHKIIKHDDWTEISIHDSEGQEIESCCLFSSLNNLLYIISVS